ncbi:hypothetical protein CL621_01670 [archaeon]|nr:hypothetical protein [archaeon]|tara:strand:+ start:346 stop:684 length:339 start_codon:yes stop_codon:yes gene_type:complete
MTQSWAIVATLFAAFLAALGAFFLKKSSFSKLNIRIFLNKFTIIAITFYGLSSVIFIIALKGGELSALYPIGATSYIWANILSIFFLKEKMNLYKWLGVIIIIIGITFVNIA